MGYKKMRLRADFFIEKGMTNRSLLRLRSGNQDAIQLTFNNARDVKQLAGISWYMIWGR